MGILPELFNVKKSSIGVLGDALRKQSGPMPATEENAALLAAAYQRHSGAADWYQAILANALAETGGDLAQAIEVADAVIEEEPEPPELTDEEEAAAMEAMGKELEVIEKYPEQKGIVRKDHAATPPFEGGVFNDQTHHWEKPGQPSGEKKPGAKKPVKPSPEIADRFAKAPATRGAMVDAVRVGKGKDAKLVMADGSEPPEHIAKIVGKIPPAWSNVKVTTDPNAEVLATGTITSKTGKPEGKTVYSAEHDMRTAALKFSRTDELLRNYDKIQEEIQRDRQDPKKREMADVSWLMSEQGTRPGSESDTKGLAKLYGKPIDADSIQPVPPTPEGEKSKYPGAKVLLVIDGTPVGIKDEGTAARIEELKANGGDLQDSSYWLKSHGATTLEGRHVVAAEDGVRLQFVGKEGVWHDHLIRNPDLAKMLVERKNAAGEKGGLFNTDETKVRDYVAERDGGGYLSKDLRTGRANLIAIREVAATPPPKNEKEYKAAVKKVAETTSGVLGNRWQQALESYVNPAVFSSWKACLA